MGIFNLRRRSDRSLVYLITQSDRNLYVHPNWGRIFVGLLTSYIMARDKYNGRTMYCDTFGKIKEDGSMMY